MHPVLAPEIGPVNLYCDVDGDGRVSLSDIDEVLANWPGMANEEVPKESETDAEISSGGAVALSGGGYSILLSVDDPLGHVSEGTPFDLIGQVTPAGIYTVEG